jgi:hypothetical protein
MSEQSPNGTEGWRERLREAVNDDLLEVRYCQRGEDVYFLLVHRPGTRIAALNSFLDAFLGAGVPPFDIRTIDVDRAAAEAESLRQYVAI